MKSRTRALLFYSFVLAFFFAAAAIIFYGSGYRYNPAKNAIERTGELIVESDPRGALVTLNGEPLLRFRDVMLRTSGARTPAHKKYLLPGNYRLGITKDGYEPYFRDISITSGTVTIVTDPVLLSNAKPQNVFSHPDLRKILVATSSRIIFLAGTREVIQLNVDTHAFESLYQTQENDIITAYPSPSRSHAIIVSDAGIFIIDENDISKVALKDIKLPITRVSWSDDEKSVFMLTASGIIRIAMDRAQASRVAEGSYIDMLLSQSTLTVIEDTEKQRSLSLIHTETGEKARVRVLSPHERIATLEAVVPPFVIGKDSEGSIIVANAADSSQERMPLAYIQGLFAKTKLLAAVASNFEAMIFEKATEEKIEKRLLMRQSIPIQTIVVARNMPYAIILSGGVLDAIEIVNIFDPNRYQLSPKGHIVRDFYIDENDILSYIAETEEGTVSFLRRSIAND